MTAREAHNIEKRSLAAAATVQEGRGDKDKEGREDKGDEGWTEDERKVAAGAGMLYSDIVI